MYKDMIDAGYNPIDADTDPTFTAGQLRMTVTGPWTTGGLDINGINYGIALVPEGMAGPMNSVEVIGFAIANVVSGEEQLAAYRFIGWWNTEDAEGNSPALTWSLENGFPSYAFSVQEKESYKSNEKLVVTSSADPSLPSDFIVDSSFAGANEILNDVILPLMSSITFEDISVEDALLFASMLMTMVRNADIVRIGCQSLIANISSCIMTRRGGEMWKQTIYYPFRLLARHARGTVLEVAGAPACRARERAGARGGCAGRVEPRAGRGGGVLRQPSGQRPRHAGAGVAGLCDHENRGMRHPDRRRQADQRDRPQRRHPLRKRRRRCRPCRST